MPNLAAVLKTEIARLARRSMRPIYAPIKRDVAAIKRALAEQRRLVARLTRDNARLIADLNTRLAAPPAASADEINHARLSPRIIKSQRARLGLSRNAFAKLLSVSSGAVVAWESARSKPRAAAMAGLIAVRKIGRREARRRLEVLVRANGKGKAPAARRRKGRRANARARAKR